MNFVKNIFAKSFKPSKKAENDSSKNIIYNIINYEKVLDIYIKEKEEEFQSILDERRKEICNDKNITHKEKIYLINKEIDAYNDTLEHFNNTISYSEPEIPPEKYDIKDYWYYKLWGKVDSKELHNAILKYKNKL